MKKLFSGFALAFSMLTIIPFFKVHNFYKGINGYAVMSYPLVGFVLGALLYGVYLLLLGHFAAVHLGIIIFALWILITGALHLDGLSDTLDGLFVPKERSLEVMKDPNVGGMGMIFTATFLILKASSLAYFESFYLLPVILMLSRFNAVIAIYFYEYLSPNGMSTLAKEEFTHKQFIITMLYTALLCFMFNGAYLLLFALLVFFLIQKFFVKRYGGFTGDIYGFTIEISELVMLNVVLFSL